MNFAFLETNDDDRDHHDDCSDVDDDEYGLDDDKNDDGFRETILPDDDECDFTTNDDENVRDHISKVVGGLLSVLLEVMSVQNGYCTNLIHGVLVSAIQYNTIR